MKIKRFFYTGFCVIVILLIGLGIKKYEMSHQRTLDAKSGKSSGESEGNMEKEPDRKENNSNIPEKINKLGRFSSSDKFNLPDEEVMDEWVQEKLKNMTLEQKTAQLFVITPEALTGVGTVIQAGETSRSCFVAYPVGGLVYMSKNLQNPEQTEEMLKNMMAFSLEKMDVPIFLCVDEEGGTVARIASNSAFGVENVGDMCEIGALNEQKAAYYAGKTIGAYLKELGFNVNFAPVADVLTNTENQLLKKRSFGSDVLLVSNMVEQVADGIKESGVLPCVKHFPGHGNTKEDSHTSYATTLKGIDELKETEFVPFEKQIENGISFIMAGHISVPNVTGDQTPASLSKVVLTDILRNELGYSQIIITDALNMGAVTNCYTSGEAAVLAIQAGADMLLMPEDFQGAYYSVLEAVRQGKITEERLDESLRRILVVKYGLFAREWID